MTTNSLVDSIINNAKVYLDIAEGSALHKLIIKEYNEARYSDAYQMTINDPWCCAFIVAIFHECGADAIIPCLAYCDGMINYFKQWGRWGGRNSHTPTRGDIVFYDWNGDGSADHVGLVVNRTFNTIRVIEGNKSDTVGYRSIDSGSSQIIGYGLPNYTAEAASMDGEVPSSDDISEVDKAFINSLPLLMKGKSGIYVKILQVLLNHYQKSNLEIDGDFGNLTYKAVQAYQESRSIEVDGIVGTETWTQLLCKEK